MNTDPTVIVRVYNNNLVLARQADGADVLLMGRALGYAKRAGDVVDSATIEMRFVPQDDTVPDRLASSLTGASMAEARLGRDIVRLAQVELGLRASQALELAVIDHLVFAVKRAHDDAEPIVVPLGWEVRHLYPREVEVGRLALTKIRDELGVQLPSDEAVAFALHFVNAQLSAPDISKAVLMTSMIAKVWKVVAADRFIDMESVAAARFVAHLRHLFNRLQGRERTGQPPAGLVTIVAQVHPEALDAARRLAVEFADVWARPIADDESAYLAIHIGRLWAETDCSG